MWSNTERNSDALKRQRYEKGPSHANYSRSEHVPVKLESSLAASSIALMSSWRLCYRHLMRTCPQLPV